MSMCGSVRLVGDVGEHRTDLTDAPRLALVAIAEARREMQAVDPSSGTSAPPVSMSQCRCERSIRPW